jgi:hypothetical protein
MIFHWEGEDMGLFDAIRRRGQRSHHLVGSISDDPTIIGDNGTRYLVFHVAEAPDTEFRLPMLPTTPKRRKGDRVELTWAQRQNGVAIVEALYASSSQESIRRRNEEYLKGIQDQDAKGPH